VDRNPYFFIVWNFSEDFIDFFVTSAERKNEFPDELSKSVEKLHDSTAYVMKLSHGYTVILGESFS
jgi:hypothetical protein